MSDHSKIEWTDATWNPLRGCTKISPGCKHCYAETFAERFRGVPGHPYQQGFDLRLVPEKLAEPFNWSGPRTVFVNSMSDLFQPGVPDSYIEDVVGVMAEANWHTYQVLTKRSERLRDLLSTKLAWAAKLRHIWWGVSVEDKKYGLPMSIACAPRRLQFASSPLSPYWRILMILTSQVSIGPLLGGESRPDARPMDKAWIERILKLCRTQDVHFFFKQWGGVHKSTTGRLLNDRTYDEMPQIVAAKMPIRKVRQNSALTWHNRAKSWSSRPTIQIMSLDAVGA